MKPDFRQAVAEDLPLLVVLLADDELGATREDATEPLDQRYLDAFDAITDDPNNELMVVEDGGVVIGLFQLTFTPYLTHKGSWRCTIESVRVAKEVRGQGLGERCIQWAVERARDRGCTLVQLTSDKQRTDALRFYESLGFRATHEGFKLKLAAGGA